MIVIKTVKGIIPSLQALARATITPRRMRLRNFMM